jgi:hypothetical protein
LLSQRLVFWAWRCSASLFLPRCEAEADAAAMGLALLQLTFQVGSAVRRFFLAASERIVAVLAARLCGIV